MLPPSILVICAGNLCRSPYAEGLLRKRLEKAGVYAEVFSRGLLDLRPQPVPREALKVAAGFGVDLSEHRSARLSLEELQRAGLVLVMSANQRKHIGTMYPPAIGKVFLLSQPEGGETVPDPIGKSEEVFREVYTQITELVDLWLERFGITPAS